jgi:hypothetical protein
MTKLALNQNLSMLSGKLKSAAGDVSSFLKKLRSKELLSEDMKYRLSFSKKYISEKYSQHVIFNHINCVFCVHLKRTSPTGHMLICMKEQYGKAAPLLPSILPTGTSYEDKFHQDDIPWYFKKPCIYFTRLSQKNYLRNFKHAFPESTTANFEILEGLEYGLLYKQKPCYICASLNFTLFRSCLSSSGYDASIPCKSIMPGIANTYYPGGRYRSSVFHASK